VRSPCPVDTIVGVPGDPGDEDALVRRAREGDVDAFAALLRVHERTARRLAAALCGADDADEVAQDAYVKAWYALAGFREDAPFRPWLLRIVANEARNRRRAAGRRARHELRFAADRSVGPSGGAPPSPEAVVVAAVGWESLVAELADLPARQRDVVMCRHVVGLSEDETALALGLPRGTVKSRAARGLARLRARVEVAGGAGGGGDDA
jgi:RNA polymerase sigma-70 factor, ECF subfamily